MILAGDIGGTHARLGLVDDRSDALDLQHTRIFPSRSFSSLEKLVLKYLAETGMRPEAAVLGIAGPVRDGIVHATNLGWVVDTQQMRNALELDRLELENDLVTTGHGIPLLPDDRFHVLNEGVPDDSGNAALIAAGTGLGVGILAREGHGFRPLPSEGGHADFAPADDEQDALLRFLRPRYQTVSWERVLSGTGLRNVYEFVLSRDGSPGDHEFNERLKNDDPAAVIAEAALAGENESCAHALTIFSRLYGTAAANLTVTFLATGGLYVGGGIGPKIVSELKSGSFLSGFLQNSDLGALLKDVPVRVVLEEKTSLIGAAHLALKLQKRR